MRLVREDGRRGAAATLLIDEHVHGHVDPADPTRLELDYQARLVTLVLALLPPVGEEDRAHVVHLGGGTFTVPRAVAHERPDVEQTVVERSRSIIALAERELGVRRGQRLSIRKADARAALSRLPDGSADLVVGDAFVDGTTPWHLTTVEAFAEAARVVKPGGCLLVNVIDEQPWSGLAAQLAGAATAFADVAVAGSRGVARLRDPGNAFLLAAPRRVDREAVASAGARARHPVALAGDGQVQALLRGVRPRRDADRGDADRGDAPASTP